MSEKITLSWQHFLRAFIAALVPLLVLLVATLLACVLGYLAVLVFGEQVSLRTVIKKSAQVLLLVSIFPAMRWLQLTKIDLGFAEKIVFFKQIIKGFSLGFITLLPVLVALYVLGIDVIDAAQPWTWVWLSKKLVLDLLLALLISCFEEPVFRGIVLTGLQRRMSTETAIIIAAIYYAGLHFLTTSTEVASPNVTFFSGFDLLGEAFQHLLRPEIFTAFLSLCAVGCFLGLLRTQIRVSLGLCIGCHACWVWQIKLSKRMFNINPHSDYQFLVSGYDGVVGPLVTIWLASVMMAYLGYLKFRLKRVI